MPNEPPGSPPSHDAPRLRDLAERVLYGTTLADKLVSFDHWRDDDPGPACAVPDRPGRPDALRLDHGRERVPFPGVHELDRAGMRGRVLHFFANHELLAAELMALALLRFPDAPASFRRGLVQTLRDEQRHLRMYHARMADDGVELGAIPVSSFFWDCLAGTDSPVHFVAGLSLTFEQANLDFSRFYADAFRAAGDLGTADALDVVWEDEIRHVAHGLAFFERHRDDRDRRATFEAWRERLTFPLTPARARGTSFDAEARARAGLTPDFITRVRTWSETKGRPPDIHLFNPLCDQPADSPASARARRVESDLEALPWVLAGADDVVLVRRRPSPEHLEPLVLSGLELPAFQIVADADSPVPCEHPHVGELRPWGWDEAAARALRLHADASVVGGAPLAERARVARSVNTKRGAAELSVDLPRALATTEAAAWTHLLDLEPPTPVASTGEAIAAIERLHAVGRAARAKVDRGSSGRGQFRFVPGEPTDALRSGAFARPGGFVGVVEAECDRRVDLSALGHVEPDGRVRWVGATRMAVDRGGVYRGSLVGRTTLGLPSHLVRFLHGGGRDPRFVRTVLEPVLAYVGQALAARGHVGAFGIDAFVHGPDDALRLRPLVEVNARTTMGHVAVALRRRLAGGVTGAFLLLRRRETGPFEAFAERLRAAAPVKCAGERAGGPIRAGALVLTDPAGAHDLLAIFVAGRTVEDLLGPVRAASDAPERLGAIASWLGAEVSVPAR